MMLEKSIKAGKLARGMNFHQKVWAITARIPRGQVVSYSDIARVLGSKAHRAVGGALNKNPYAPVVPCHRVVGWNGKLTGYLGGLAAKRRMLVEEGVRFVSQQRVDMSQRARL